MTPVYGCFCVETGPAGLGIAAFSVDAGTERTAPTIVLKNLVVERIGGRSMTEHFSIERVVALLEAGELVHVEPKTIQTLDLIASGCGVEGRNCRDGASMMTCLWSIRICNENCVPFIHFDGITDADLRKNFVLFDQHRTDIEKRSALLVGSRDIWGPELDGKPNDVLGEKVIHLLDAKGA